MGQHVCDRLSGLSGYVICRLDHITGCTQYYLQPPVAKKDGTLPAVHVFDEDRLELTGKPAFAIGKIRTDGADPRVTADVLGRL